MASKMKVELALANLEAGKFSFRMVDAIKDHVDKLENELNVVRNLHIGAMDDLRQQELVNWRLEGELRKANAKIHALLKANMLTVTVFQVLTAVVLKLTEYLRAAKKDALPKANMLVKNSFRELRPVAAKLMEYFQVAIKDALPKANVMPQRAVKVLTALAIKVAEYLQVARKDAQPKAKMLVEKAFEVMTPVTMKMGDNLKIFKKHAGAASEKATAYLSTLHKTGA